MSLAIKRTPADEMADNFASEQMNKVVEPEGWPFLSDAVLFHADEAEEFHPFELDAVRAMRTHKVKRQIEVTSLPPRYWHATDMGIACRIDDAGNVLPYNLSGRSLPEEEIDDEPSI